MNQRLITTLTIINAVILGGGLLFVALSGCCRQEPPVTYRIPPEKQEAAAELTLKLTQSMSWSGYSPMTVSETVRKQVERIYGEPIVQPVVKP